MKGGGPEWGTDRLDWAEVPDALGSLPSPAGTRVEVDAERVERGLAKLVLTLIEFLKELMERQAIRRLEAGTLTDDETERLGMTFKRLSERMEELKREFGLEDEELNLDLGPLGRLM